MAFRRNYVLDTGYGDYVKRHPSLVSLSHDHHHALVQARRLRRADGGPEARETALAFAQFFAGESARHFREEEEIVFPTVVDFPEARSPLVEALLDHQHLRRLAATLEREREPLPEVMKELGERLEAHVRLEERTLFPLIERLVDDATLADIERALTKGNSSEPGTARPDQS